jgi:hypothetical protein
MSCSTLEQVWNEAANRVALQVLWCGVELTARRDEMAARAAVWAQVQAAYQKGASLSELSRSSGLSRTAIRTRARLEGWTKPDAEQEPVPCHAVSKDRRPNAVHPPLDALPDERHALIRQHRREWRDLDRLRREAIRAASASHSPAANPGAEESNRVSTKEQLGHAKLLMGLYKTAVEAITTKQEGERRAHGFDYKLQQEVGSVDKQKAERDARLAIEWKEWADRIGLSCETEDVH